MTPLFAILAGLTVGAAVAALTRRNLVHAALWLTAAFVGLALVYLQLGAEFVGFVQVLVYVGAVAILILFAVLLTRSGTVPAGRVSGGLPSGLGVALAVFGVLAWAIRQSPAAAAAAPGPVPPLAVKPVGEYLATDGILALQVTGLLLTSALLGAVVVALGPGRRAEPGESRGRPPSRPSPPS